MSRPTAEKPGPPQRQGRMMGEIVGGPYRERSTFQPGFVLQERFRILRFLARGGAGEVYEAFDTELRCPVALKLVRPEVATNESAVERFRREIALARQVTHPNVSRIFDVFRVEVPGRTVQEEPIRTLFLTMELLVGESLASRIHRLGPLSAAQALPLVIDMVEGLKAAHRAGVIHRDLKSANVMLARQGDEIRAVIMDFGLAQERTYDADDPNPLTNSGVVVGTPNYMAPEQLTGGKITPAVDQYALGIVLFEMLTGQRPFRGENEVSTAVKRLTEKPPSPRTLAPDLDRHWETTILRMLEIEPEDRFPRLDDISHMLVGNTTPILLPEAPRRRGVRPRLLFLAGGALLVALALSQAAPELIARGSQSPPLAAHLVQTQGVAPLAVRSLQRDAEPGDAAWMGTALDALLAYSLHGDGLSVSLTPPAEEDGVPVRRTRLELGTPLYLEGSYRVPGGTDGVRLDLAYHDDLPPARQITVTGVADDLAGLAATAATAVREAAGLKGEVTVSGDVLGRAAFRELRAGRWRSAEEILRESRERELAAPEHLAQLALLRHRLGRGTAARAVLAEAEAASRSETPEAQRLVVIAASAEVSGDTTRGVEATSRLAELRPDEPWFGAWQARLLLRAGRSDEALEAIGGIGPDGLRRVPEAMLTRSRVLEATGDRDAARQAAGEALALADELGSVSVAARALLERGRLLLLDGALDAAGDDFEAVLRRIDAEDHRARRGALQGLLAIEEAVGDTAAAERRQREIAALPPADAP